MEIKSRYEVISDLERQKRDLIKERDSLNDIALMKQKLIKEIERKKSDTILILDRQIEDIRLELEEHKNSVETKKETINELIKSVDESLLRFNNMPSK